jgi:hypothetical protein
MSLYTPNSEERAFLYQEAHDLEALMKDLGSLTVMVEQVAYSETEKKKSQYRVTFVVAPESVGMRVQATDSNLFDATIAAKDETARQLNALVNALPRAPQSETTGSPLPPELLH